MDKKSTLIYFSSYLLIFFQSLTTCIPVSCIFYISREVLGGDSIYAVPAVIDELSTKHVITTELIKGVPIDQVKELDQDTRNYVRMN